MTKLLKDHRAKLLWLLPLVFLALFYFYPLAKMIGVSFGRAQDGPLSVIINKINRKIFLCIFTPKFQSRLPTIHSRQPFSMLIFAGEVVILLLMPRLCPRYKVTFSSGQASPVVLTPTASPPSGINETFVPFCA